MAKKYLDEQGLESVINRIKADYPKKANSLAGYGIDDAYTKTECDEQIAAAVSSVYKPLGSSTFANLPDPSTLAVGDVYNVSDDFTTTGEFIEGAGKSFPAGTNVVVVDNGGQKMWDVLSGMVDLSDYAKLADFEPISTAEIDAMWNDGDEGSSDEQEPDGEEQA